MKSALEPFLRRKFPDIWVSQLQPQAEPSLQSIQLLVQGMELIDSSLKAKAKSQDSFVVAF